MPRTKFPKTSSNKDSKPTKAQLTQESINCYFKALEDELKRREEKITAEFERIMLKTNSTLSETTLKFSRQDAGKTMTELRKEQVNASVYEVNSSKSIHANMTKSIHKSNNETKNGKALLQSRLHSTIKKAKHIGRPSRSLSRSKLQQAAQTLSSFKTPLQKTISALSFGTITPKVKPNIPQVVLRRPKQGEMALSMQGSPLMVSSVSSDALANVNIPLQDGRILTIQPQRGLRTSQIPDFDPETRRQIETLRDNLNKVCARPLYP
ncbi:hypothetical protein ILUMI_12519 [Ignelater luminosus]|uniref:Borealin C-terminal domain-containing protein n=1 Tax=Ignelater luminosus TaxID=2038154 RepID=A0A8K0CU54_IGNLU|nr:hypothetical protein ILUMI_12519 [Ignelater luminosus]